MMNALSLPTLSRNKTVKAAFGNKFYVMVFFLCLDMGLNSTLDYDIYSEGKRGFIILGLLGLQIIVQISVFLILFLTVADTFLFRVGLLGLLMRKIKTVLIVQLIYFAFTVATGVLRVSHYDRGQDLLSLTTSSAFTSLSIVQKIGRYSLLHIICSDQFQ